MSDPAPAPLRVDIVIDNHDYGRFLATAIESACAQTHPRTRVIVVDDGSTDDSREVLRGFEDRVEVVLKENGGQASALNAGAALCTGEVVIFLDADDLLHPQAAARAAAALAAEPAAVKVSMRMEVIDEDGRPTGETKPPARLRIPAGDLRRAGLAYPFDLPWLPTSGNAFRLEPLRQILPIPEGRERVGADWYLIHLSTLLGPAAAVDEVSCAYRVHGANSYEQQGAEIDLDRVRATVRYGQETAAELLALARRLGLRHPERILSVADVGQRLISLRLDPRHHPVPDDTVPGLLRDSAAAVSRRDNVSMALRLAFRLWFGAMAVSPRPMARHLARWFLFPSRRRLLSRAFGGLQRP
ncbi:MAG: glycosyltransferase family A protein [Syntrophothermus sp.]